MLHWEGIVLKRVSVESCLLDHDRAQGRIRRNQIQLFMGGVFILLEVLPFKLHISLGASICTGFKTCSLLSLFSPERNLHNNLYAYHFISNFLKEYGSHSTKVTLKRASNHPWQFPPGIPLRLKKWLLFGTQHFAANTG